MNKNNIEVIVEIAKNSNIKYEYDTQRKIFVLDRILFGSCVYPENYGFIQETLDYDGDPLDVLLITNSVLMPGALVNAKIIGVMYMVDEGEVDNKLLCVIKGDSEFEYYEDINDISKFRLNKIKDFFTNYKLLEKKKVEIKNFGNKSEGLKILEECINLFKKRK